jgi:hypothetical protein
MRISASKNNVVNLFSRLVKEVSTGTLGLCLIALLCAGCSPMKFPGLKQWAQSEQERITKETQKAINTSPTFQELDRLCTKEIPLPADFQLVKLDRSKHSETFLDYGYHSDTKNESIKAMYREYFLGRGWRLAGEKVRGWGDAYIEFTNENYRVKIYYFGPGTGVNYSVLCEKLSPTSDKH